MGCICSGQHCNPSVVQQYNFPTNKRQRKVHRQSRFRRIGNPAKLTYLHDDSTLTCNASIHEVHDASTQTPSPHSFYDSSELEYGDLLHRPYVCVVDGPQGERNRNFFDLWCSHLAPPGGLIVLDQLTTAREMHGAAAHIHLHNR